jgi:hypothetical protein
MVKQILICLSIWCIYEQNLLHQVVVADEAHQIKDTSELISRSVSIDLETFALDKKRNLPNTSVYNEVLSYYSNPFGDKYGRSTNVHETVHDINSTISNLKMGYRAFYIGAGRCVWIKKPLLTMTDIIPYIPNTLRGYRYKTYFVENIKEWNDNALYPVDEWSAYICGAECAVDDHLSNIKAESKEDSVSGTLEFSIYGIALCMAIKDKDPEYWHNNMQYRHLIHLFLIKSENIFFEGKDVFPSDKQDILLKSLRTDTNAKNIKDFLIKEFHGIFIQ